ncbi:MAG: glycosyltransferase [Verrucomicrobiaceae bacterium]|nr:glycosyltransferase [Verrucomicrobiaceae bacterium]
MPFTGRSNNSEDFAGGEAPANASGQVLDICVITYLTSPYQVEFFNEIATHKGVRLRVIYLHEEVRLYPWAPVECRHEFMILEGSRRRIAQAFKWAREASLTVCNYYTHWFALAALHARHLGGRPWVFWGESPGFLQLGWLGKLGRKMLLYPIARSDAPVWGIGRTGVSRYKQDWGDSKDYVNLPYFSDLQRFRTQTRTAPADVRCILYSGVLRPRKGVLELAEAFRAAALQNGTLRLVILGGGPLEDQMRTILDPVRHLVRWEGFRQWHELPALYAQAHVLCLPTKYDGWAMVVPEALAAGLPVLTTREAGAAVELVEDGVNGWLMPAVRTQCITESLLRIAALSNDELEKLGVTARESVRDHSLAEGGTRFVAAAWGAIEAFHCRLASGRAGLPPSAPKIFITGPYPPDRLNSMIRYVDLLRSVTKDFPWPVEQLDPPVIFGALRRLPARLRRLLEYLDKYVFFPLKIRWRAGRNAGREGCFVHITDQGFGPLAPWIADFPVVVTCHDLIAIRAALGLGPAARRAPWRGWFQRLIRRTLCLPATVICDSEKTRGDCEQLLSTGSVRHVLHLPLDPEFTGDTGGIEVPALPERFFLHVGNSLWYKNRPGVLQIFAALCEKPAMPPKLVFMGEPPTADELRIASTRKIEDRVVWIPRPPTAWIMAAYDRAQALIFPSLEEGFGWPVLEAMSRGCPVFCSDRAPLSEIGGDAVVYIDPESPAAAADVIAGCMVQGGPWRSAQAAKGKSRAAGFSVPRFSAGMMGVYQSVIDRFTLEGSREAEHEPMRDASPG